MARAKDKQDLRIPLRAVAYRHGEWWIAHCLELDLVAEGHSPTEALRDLLDLSATQIKAAIKRGDLASIFRPAPPEIWATFSRAGDARVGKKPRRPVERFEAREAALV